MAGENYRQRIVEYMRRLFLVAHLTSVVLLAFSVISNLIVLSSLDFWSLLSVCLVLIPVLLVFYVLLWIIYVLWKPQTLFNPSPETSTLDSRVKAALLRSCSHKVGLSIGFVIVISLVLFSAYATSSLCRPTEPDDLDSSSRLTRWFWHGTGKFVECPKEGVCHVYLLLAPHPDTQMQIVYHTTGKPKHAKVLYGTKASDLRYHSQGYSHHLELVRDTTRYVNTVLLTDLQPNTTYYFKCLYGHSHKLDSSVRKFLTLPNTVHRESEQPFIRFAVGGDLGVRHSLAKMTQTIASMYPHFVAIGGDLAYGTLFSHCVFASFIWAVLLLLFIYLSSVSRCY